MSSSNGNGFGHGSPRNGKSEVKRGRDRDEEAGPSSSKFARTTSARPESGKKREEFVDQPITRPKNLDKNGRSEEDVIVKMKANYFQFRQEKRISITAYRLDFEPVTEIFGLRKFLVNQQRSVLGGLVYDGANQIYLMRPVSDDPTSLQSTSRDGQQFTLTLRSPRVINYTEGIFLQVYNLMVRNAMRSLNLQFIGRNHYDANAAITVPNYNLEIWPGYITSVRQHEQNILLCCDISNKVMRNENVLRIIGTCIKDSRNFRDEAMRKIIGSTVLTRYNNKTYRVSDIDWDQNPLSTFPTKNGPMSFVDYYKTKYGKLINDLEQPLLVSKANARNIRAGQAEFILLIPELCDATGITDEMRSNFTMMREIIAHTRLTPGDRVARLEQFNARLHGTPESMHVFEDNFVQLSHSLVEFEGRILPQENIKFGNKKIVDLGHASVRNRADWTRDLANSKMYIDMMSVKLKNWYYVYPARQEQSANDFMRNFMQAAGGLSKSEITRPINYALRNDDQQSYIRELEGILRKDPSFIMVVVPNNRSDRYGAIKKLALCRKNPVSVQVIVEKTMKNKQRLLSIATKVAIQVNCKLGGIPWICNLRLNGILVIGYATTRNTSSKTRESFGAMVASMNPNADGGEFFSLVDEHSNGDELSANFGTNIILAIRKYRERNNMTLPKRILIYRDGVGDGQIQHVIDQELNDVKMKIKRIYQKCGQTDQEKIGFVLLNKKTNTRLFAMKGRTAENPDPGTVVDDVITLPERYDFYLVSPSTNQGSISPTYYNVINDGFFPNRPDAMQAMTFKLCHLYYNWSGTTCVPSVVQYAKKLAILVGQHMHAAPSPDLSIEKQLYFL